MAQSTVVVAAVDDDRRIRESVQSVLESAGYQAVTFGSAEAFLDSGVLSKIACLLADVRLPGIDGIELQRHIRNDRPTLPVIFMTAHDDDNIRQRALRDGIFHRCELQLARGHGAQALADRVPQLVRDEARAPFDRGAAFLPIFFELPRAFEIVEINRDDDRNERQ